MPLPLTFILTPYPYYWIKNLTYPWLLNSFIQMTCYHNKALVYYDYNFRLCPFLAYQRIKREILGKDTYQLIESFINLLNGGYYITALVNIKYIKAHNVDFSTLHELFIYGYDDEKQIFYIADNFYGSFNYRSDTCSFQESFINESGRVI